MTALAEIDASVFNRAKPSLPADPRQRRKCWRGNLPPHAGNGVSAAMVTSNA